MSLLCLVVLMLVNVEIVWCTKTATFSLSESMTLTSSISLPTGSNSYSATVSLPSATRSISLPTVTVTRSYTFSRSLTLPSGSLSSTLPTLTKTFTSSLTSSMSLPTLTVSFSLPTDSRSVTYSLSRSYSLSHSETVSLSLPTITSTKSHSLSTTLSATKTVTISLSQTSLTETFTFSKLTITNYTSWIRPDNFIEGQEVRVRVQSLFNELYVSRFNSSSPMSAQIEIYRHLSSLEVDCNVYHKRGTELLHRSTHYGLDTEVRSVEYAESAFFTFTAPSWNHRFIICLQHHLNDDWKYLGDEDDWVLLNPQQRILQSRRSETYFYTPHPTVRQYAVMQLESFEYDWNFTYAGSHTCGHHSDIYHHGCTKADNIKIVKHGEPCTSERTFIDSLPYYGSYHLNNGTGVWNVEAIPGLFENTSPGGAGVFGTKLSNPIMRPWSSQGVYLNTSVFVYIKLPEESGYYDICFSSISQRLHWSDQNSSIPSAPMWRKLKRCLNIDSCATSTEDYLFVRDEILAWNATDVSAGSWGNLSISDENNQLDVKDTLRIIEEIYFNEHSIIENNTIMGSFPNRGCWSESSSSIASIELISEFDRRKVSAAVHFSGDPLSNWIVCYQRFKDNNVIGGNMTYGVVPTTLVVSHNLLLNSLTWDMNDTRADTSGPLAVSFINSTLNPMSLLPTNHSIIRFVRQGYPCNGIVSSPDYVYPFFITTPPMIVESGVVFYYEICFRFKGNFFKIIRNFYPESSALNDVSLQFTEQRPGMEALFIIEGSPVEVGIGEFRITKDVTCLSPVIIFNNTPEYNNRSVFATAVLPQPVEFGYSLCFQYAKYSENWIVFKTNWNPTAETRFEVTTAGQFLSGGSASFTISFKEKVYPYGDDEVLLRKLSARFVSNNNHYGCLSDPSKPSSSTADNMIDNTFNMQAVSSISFSLVVPDLLTQKLKICIQIRENNTYSYDGLSWWTNSVPYTVIDNGIRWKIKQLSDYEEPVNTGIVTVELSRLAFGELFPVFSRSDIVKIVPSGLSCENSTHVGIEHADKINQKGWIHNLGPSDTYTSTAVFRTVLPAVEGDASISYKICIQASYPVEMYTSLSSLLWVEVKKHDSNGTSQLITKPAGILSVTLSSSLLLFDSEGAFISSGSSSGVVDISGGSQQVMQGVSMIVNTSHADAINTTTDQIKIINPSTMDCSSDLSLDIGRYDITGNVSVGFLLIFQFPRIESKHPTNCQICYKRKTVGWIYVGNQFRIKASKLNYEIKTNTLYVHDVLVNSDISNKVIPMSSWCASSYINSVKSGFGYDCLRSNSQPYHRDMVSVVNGFERCPNPGHDWKNLTYLSNSTVFVNDLVSASSSFRRICLLKSSFTNSNNAQFVTKRGLIYSIGVYTPDVYKISVSVQKQSDTTSKYLISYKGESDLWVRSKKIDDQESNLICYFKVIETDKRSYFVIQLLSQRCELFFYSISREGLQSELITQETTSKYPDAVQLRNFNGKEVLCNHNEPCMLDFIPHYTGIQLYAPLGVVDVLVLSRSGGVFAINSAVQNKTISYNVTSEGVIARYAALPILKVSHNSGAFILRVSILNGFSLDVHVTVKKIDALYFNVRTVLLSPNINGHDDTWRDSGNGYLIAGLEYRLILNTNVPLSDGLQGWTVLAEIPNSFGENTILITSPNNKIMTDSYYYVPFKVRNNIGCRNQCVMSFVMKNPTSESTTPRRLYCSITSVVRVVGDSVRIHIGDDLSKWRPSDSDPTSFQTNIKNGIKIWLIPGTYQVWNGTRTYLIDDFHDGKYFTVVESAVKRIALRDPTSDSSGCIFESASDQICEHPTYSVPTWTLRTHLPCTRSNMCLFSFHSSEGASSVSRLMGTLSPSGFRFSCALIGQVRFPVSSFISNSFAIELRIESDIDGELYPINTTVSAGVNSGIATAWLYNDTIPRDTNHTFKITNGIGYVSQIRLQIPGDRVESDIHVITFMIFQSDGESLLQSGLSSSMCTLQLPIEVRSVPSDLSSKLSVQISPDVPLEIISTDTLANGLLIRITSSVLQPEIIFKNGQVEIHSSDDIVIWSQGATDAFFLKSKIRPFQNFGFGDAEVQASSTGRNLSSPASNVADIIIKYSSQIRSPAREASLTFCVERNSQEGDIDCETITFSVVVLNIPNLVVEWVTSPSSRFMSPFCSQTFGLNDTSETQFSATTIYEVTGLATKLIYYATDISYRFLSRDESQPTGSVQNVLSDLIYLSYNLTGVYALPEIKTFFVRSLKETPPQTILIASFDELSETEIGSSRPLGLQWTLTQGTEQFFVIKDQIEQNEEICTPSGKNTPPGRRYYESTITGEVFPIQIEVQTSTRDRSWGYNTAVRVSGIGITPFITQLEYGGAIVWLSLSSVGYEGFRYVDRPYFVIKFDLCYTTTSTVDDCLNQDDAQESDITYPERTKVSKKIYLSPPTVDVLSAELLSEPPTLVGIPFRIRLSTLGSNNLLVDPPAAVDVVIFSKPMHSPIESVSGSEGFLSESKFPNLTHCGMYLPTKTMNLSLSILRSVVEVDLVFLKPCFQCYVGIEYKKNDTTITTIVIPRVRIETCGTQWSSGTQQQKLLKGVPQSITVRRVDANGNIDRSGVFIGSSAEVLYEESQQEIGMGNGAGGIKKLLRQTNIPFNGLKLVVISHSRACSVCSTTLHRKSLRYEVVTNADRLTIAYQTPLQLKPLNGNITSAKIRIYASDSDSDIDTAISGLIINKIPEVIQISRRSFIHESQPDSQVYITNGVNNDVFWAHLLVPRVDQSLSFFLPNYQISSYEDKSKGLSLVYSFSHFSISSVSPECYDLIISETAMNAALPQGVNCRLAAIAYGLSPAGEMHKTTLKDGIRLTLSVDECPCVVYSKSFGEWNSTVIRGEAVFDIKVEEMITQSCKCTLRVIQLSNVTTTFIAVKLELHNWGIQSIVLNRENNPITVNEYTIFNNTVYEINLVGKDATGLAIPLNYLTGSIISYESSIRLLPMPYFTQINVSIMFDNRIRIVGYYVVEDEIFNLQGNDGFKIEWLSINKDNTLVPQPIPGSDQLETAVSLVVVEQLNQINVGVDFSKLEKCLIITGLTKQKLIVTSTFSVDIVITDVKTEIISNRITKTILKGAECIPIGSIVSHIGDFSATVSNQLFKVLNKTISFRYSGIATSFTADIPGKYSRHMLPDIPITIIVCDRFGNKLLGLKEPYAIYILNVSHVPVSLTGNYYSTVYFIASKGGTVARQSITVYDGLWTGFIVSRPEPVQYNFLSISLSSRGFGSEHSVSIQDSKSLSVKVHCSDASVECSYEIYVSDNNNLLLHDPQITILASVRCLNDEFDIVIFGSRLGSFLPLKPVVELQSINGLFRLDSVTANVLCSSTEIVFDAYLRNELLLSTDWKGNIGPVVPGVDLASNDTTIPTTVFVASLQINSFVVREEALLAAEKQFQYPQKLSTSLQAVTASTGVRTITLMKSCVVDNVNTMTCYPLGVGINEDRGIVLSGMYGVVVFFDVELYPLVAVDQNLLISAVEADLSSSNSVLKSSGVVDTSGLVVNSVQVTTASPPTPVPSTAVPPTFSPPTSIPVPPTPRPVPTLTPTIVPVPFSCASSYVCCFVWLVGLVLIIIM